MDHRAFLERWFAALWDERKESIIDECVAESCRIVGLPATESGRESFRSFFRAFGAAFPKVKIRVEECISQDDRFAMRCSGYVVDRRGRQHAFTGGGMGRIHGGQLVEAWNQWDFLSVLASMGAVPRDAFADTIRAEAAR
jgi:hypothetical protein